MRCRRKRQRIAAAAFCAASWEEGRPERRSARRRLLVRRDHAVLRLVCLFLLGGDDSSSREPRLVGENRCRIGLEGPAVNVNSVRIPYRASRGVVGVFAERHNADRRPMQATLCFAHTVRIRWAH